jgi:uncharacterized membrane protein
VLVGDFIQNLFKPEIPFTANEVNDLNIAITTAVLMVVCCTVYFGSMLFYKRTTLRYREQVEKFFKQMNTPIDVVKEGAGSIEGDKRQYNVLGSLCLIYGGVVLVLTFVPNPLIGRLSVLFCGGTIFVTGFILRIIARKLRANNV